MRFVILGLLLEGPLSLYDLRKRFAAGISLFYSASFGSLQRALQGLIADGSVRRSAAQGDARGRQLYTVTASGRQAWSDWMLAEVDEGADAETKVLAKVFLLGRLPAADRPAALSGARTPVAAQAQRLRRLQAELDAGDVPAEHREAYRYQRASLDYGVRATELLLAWLDDVEEPR